jgi:hypothetical protein
MSMMRDWTLDELLQADPREDKQPVWVRDRLRSLRRALREQRDLAARAVKGTDAEGSTAILEPWEDHGGIGLGKRPTVRFQAPGRGYVDITVRDDAVELHGQHDLVIRPKVSNVAEVYSHNTKQVFG